VGHTAGPLLARDPKDKLFCEIAIDLGFIAQAQANHALEQQRVDEAIGQRKPVGAYLHGMNLLSREQIAQILKMQDRVEKAVPAPTAHPPHLQPRQQVAPSPSPAGSPGASSTSRVVYILLGVFLGCLGVHNFVAGYTGRGIAQLLITLLLGWVYFLGIIVTGIWVIVEIIVITQDAQGRPFT